MTPMIPSFGLAPASRDAAGLGIFVTDSGQSISNTVASVAATRSAKLSTVAGRHCCPVYFLLQKRLSFFFKTQLVLAIL